MRTITLIALCLTVNIVGAWAQGKVKAISHVIVYKTRDDYRELVPVTLSDDGMSVISYPEPTDLRTGSGYPLPVLLHKGFLLDKRGVGRHTAFLNITYREYSKLKTAPAREAMLRMIKNKKPLTALYDCGSRVASKNTVRALNALIDSKQIGKSCIAMQ